MRRRGSLSKSQRTKGAVGEREICAIFSAALGQKFERNIGQARDGGNDIDVGPLVIEVKRRKTLGTVYGWLRQAMVAAAERKKQPAIPVVVAREDGGFPIVILSLGDFLFLTHEWLRADLGAGA